MAKVELEDGFEDILGKAVRGMNLNPKTLSFLTGLEADRIESVLKGAPEEDIIRSLASVLALDDKSLIERMNASWAPQEVEIEGLRQFETPHNGWSVNNYVVWDPETMKAAVFDTGSDLDEAYSLVQALGLDVQQLFITHTHIDHIQARDQLAKWGKITTRVCEKEPVSNAEKFAIGDQFKIGDLKVETRATWGHSPGATTFVISGLGRPVAIVGDAIFAQSMGGGVVSYQAALETNRKEIFTLKDETILCPGHGPMTSVAEEKAHNPFFPEFK